MNLLPCGCKLMRTGAQATALAPGPREPHACTASNIPGDKAKGPIQKPGAPRRTCVKTCARTAQQWGLGCQEPRIPGTLEAKMMSWAGGHPLSGAQ